MRVLLIGNGEPHHIGASFRNSLVELGYEYAFFDDSRFTSPRKYLTMHKIAYRLLQRRPLAYWALNHQIMVMARQFKPSLILITKGAYISPKTLVNLRQQTGAFLMNYATDDPFNPVNYTPDLVAGIRFYDLYACTKRAILDDVRRAGCPAVSYIRFGYEPYLHFPERPLLGQEQDAVGSDMVFVGGGDGQRFPLIRKIATLPGIKFRLYGTYWDRDPLLRHHYDGYASGRRYRVVLGGTKIALCLLRWANRDTHTMRTFEIPACGAFMLADRTDEHLALFDEDKEAVYFSSEDELVEKVQYYLKHDTARQQIAEAGYDRVIRDKHTYRDRLLELLQLANATKV